MQSLWNRFTIGWCRTFHARPSWPLNGHYHCPTCLRTYPVPWHEGEAFAQKQLSQADSKRVRPGFVVFQFQKNRG